MTNIQLLLLATNNIKNNSELSHSEESYVYQFYYSQVVNHFDNISDYIIDFIQQTSATLEASPQLAEQSSIIYSTVERYLTAARKRYIERQKQLQK